MSYRRERDLRLSPKSSYTRLPSLSEFRLFDVFKSFLKIYIFQDLTHHFQMMSKRELLPVLTSLLLDGITNKTMGKERAGTSDNGVQFKGRTSAQQTAAFHHLGAGSMLSATGNTRSCNYYKSENSSQQSSFVQNQTPTPSNGLQVINQSNLFQESQLINSHPPQCSLQKKNADSSLQNMMVHWKPRAAVQQRQTLYDNHRANISHNSVTSMTAKPALMSGTTATTSPPHQQSVYTGQYGSSLTHSNQNSNDRCNGENKTQEVMYYCQKVPNYVYKFQQPRRDDHIRTVQNQQGVQVCHMGQRRQQRPAPLNHTSLSKQAIEQDAKREIILRIADDLRRSYPVNEVVCSPTNNNSLYRVQPNNINQPMPTNTSNAGQSLVYIPGKTLSEYIPVRTRTQDMAGSSPNGSCFVLNLLMIDQNNSSGKDRRNSQTLDTPPSALEDTCPVSTPPCCTNARAIAVVQPLAQQGCHVSLNHAAFDVVSDKSAATSASKSPADVSEKPACAPHLNFRLADKMLEDQRDAQKSSPSDVSRSQTCETSHDLKTSISKISSDLTVTWTIKELQKLIQVEEEAQRRSSDLPVHCTAKLHQLFSKTLNSSAARKGLLHCLLESNMFLQKHKMTDTVITQLKPGFENQLQRYHVLKDNQLYSETPFSSSWLNKNDRLDDIDKEFGLPPCLRCTGIGNLDSQPELLTATTVTPGQNSSKVPGKDLAKMEPKPVESDVRTQVQPKPANSDVGMQVKPKLVECGVESKVEPKLVESDVETQPCSVESSPIQAASPGNPFYSFEIQVLPPDEAKLIYEQTESPEHHSEVASVENRELGHRPEKDACSSLAVEVLLDETDDTPDTPVEEICCLSRLIRSIFESNPPLGKCQCGAKQSVEAVIDLTEGDTSHDSGKEMMVITGKCPREVIISIENQEDSSTAADAPLCPEIDVLKPSADLVSIQSMRSAAGDSEVENPNDSDVEVSGSILEAEENKLSDVSPDSSMETEEQTPVCTTAPLHKCTPARCLTGKSENESKSERCAVSPFLKKSSLGQLAAEAESQLPTRPEVAVDPPVRKDLDSNCEDVQLKLYGSVQQHPQNARQRKRFFLPEGTVCAMSMPPETLSVPLRSLKRQFSDPLPVQEQSVKNRIFELWKKSFPVTQLRQRAKKIQKSAFSPGAKNKPPDSPLKKMKLNLLKSSLRPKCRMETNCINPGEL